MNKKPFIVLLATLIFLFSFLNFNLKAVNVQREEDAVFLVDRSMHTSAERLEEIRREIEELSNYYTSVSVIEFNDRANVVIEKSRNTADIVNSIKAIPFGFSNPGAAIEAANKIDFNNTKDIILFTSFYPNIGKIESKGAYTSRDHFYFRNANAFSSEVKALSENTRLITVGDFSGLKNKDYNFVKKLYTENSDLFIEKNNNQNLTELIFQQAQEENTNKNPIIFIPGISGSELFIIDDKYVDEHERKTGMIGADKEFVGERIWMPIGYDLKKINEDLSIKQDLYGLQQGDLRFANVFTRHTGPFAIYSSFFDKLISNFPDRPIYLFSYDWRKSNVETAEKLDAFIDSINDSGNLQVDIIAHSMGGLVSSHYLKEHSHKVDKYLSFATPYEGAPKAFNGHSENSILGGFIDVLLEKIVGIELDLVQDFDGLIELYPTQKLLEKYEYQLALNEAQVKSEVAKNRYDYESLKNKLYLTHSAKSLSAYEVMDLMKEHLGEQKYNEMINKMNSYHEANDINNYNILLNRPNSMFFVSTGVETAVSGYYTKDQNGKLHLNEITTKEGDGMVPLYSATMGLEFDEMTAEQREKFVMINGDHMAMLMDLGNLEKMCRFLSDRPVK